MNTLLKLSILISIIFALSSKSWLFVWMMMEFNMMCFIFMIKKNNMKTLNSIIKYFVTQTFASSIMLMVILTKNMTPGSMLIENTLFLTIWMKLGMYPFSNWFLQVNENLDLNSFFYMNILQKIIPFFILSLVYTDYYMKYFIIMSIIFSSIDMLNQTSLRWILSCSSINHFSWMSLSLYQNNIWQVYMLVYVFTLYLTMNFMINYDYNSINCLMQDKDKLNKFKMIILMMSFGGVPPLIGFLPKLMIILLSKEFIIIMTLILMSIFNIYVYSRISISMLSKLNKMHLMKNKSDFLLIFMINSCPLMIMSFMM